MKVLRIISGDPASESGNDAFGTVGLEATYPNMIIHIRLAKQHKRESYYTIAKYYSKIKKKINPDLILLEKNFDYDKLLPIFSNINPTYVTMSSRLTEKTRKLMKSVDKPWVINEIHKLHKNHQIQYPSTLSADMQELVNQRNEMSGIVGATGKTTYKRTRNRHDDIFMAKLLGINAILHWWEELKSNG